MLCFAKHNNQFNAALSDRGREGAIILFSSLSHPIKPVHQIFQQMHTSIYIVRQDKAKSYCDGNNHISFHLLAHRN